MKLRLVGLAALAFAIACEPTREPTALTAPSGPSEIISDGAHGGNKDFFFLPPMVPLPVGNPDFELGKFNNTLRSALKVEICELKAQNLNAQGLPTESTGCIAGAPLKTFAPGSVQLVNLPVRQNGWWNAFGLPPDGFYYVLWDTRQSNLNVSKYYRIKVFIDGSTTPLGIADVDPMANLFQWKYTNSGQVIQLVDDVLLPIPFRVEKGGGSALCGSSSLCVSTTVSNNNPAGFQTVTVEGGAGAIAGVKFPNGWLPANGPQNVVVTIASVDLGGTNAGNGTSLKPCHAGLPLQQFPGCFNFSTTPRLAYIGDTDHQFAQPVIVAVCYSLQNTGDPREKFAEMYSSGPNEPPHALEDASDAGLLGPAARNCNTAPVIGAAPSKGVTGFASASWRKLKTGVSSVFGIKTAYAVDLGLGGFAFAFSNIGPALSAEMDPVGSTEISVSAGGHILQPMVRLVGSNHHDGGHRNSTGLGGIPVQFQVAATDGNIAPLGDEVGNLAQLTAVTNTNPIDPESPTSGGGYASVNWRVPSQPGTYHITATGPALDAPVTFTVTVSIAPVDLGVLPDMAGSVALANNDAGHVVGYSYTNTNPQQLLPFILINGQMTSLGSVGGQIGEATGININDEVCGSGGTGPDGIRAFRWKDGVTTALETFPGSVSSWATGINSAGQIVGYSLMQDGNYRSWIWQNGTYTDLGLPEGASSFSAVAINDAGQVAGSDNATGAAAVWQNGVFTPLPSPGQAAPIGINSAGAVVGYYFGAGHAHAVVWQNGVMTELGHLAGDSDSQAESMNSAGIIVGLSYFASETQAFVAHAFMWKNGQMTDLGALTPGGTFAEAIAINSSGQIVGQSVGNAGGRATLWQAP